MQLKLITSFVFQDKMLEESQECGQSLSGNNEILAKALGTPEYSGHVQGKVKHHAPQQYFNYMVDHDMWEFLKESKEWQSQFEANILTLLR